MVMCPGPHSMFCLWHSCSSLTSQQHLQDFSWNWKTDIKFATICAKQLFLSITLDAYCFSRTFCIMAKICGSTICSDNKEHNFCFFVYCLVPSSSQLNVFLTCDTAIWLWICNICTTYKREWCYLLSGVLRYLAHSREQYHTLNGKHTKSYLQCKAQGFFIVQIPLMNSTQISPLACSSKMNAKEFFYNYTSFSKN